MPIATSIGSLPPNLTEAIMTPVKCTFWSYSVSNPSSWVRAIAHPLNAATLRFAAERADPAESVPAAAHANVTIRGDYWRGIGGLALLLALGLLFSGVLCDAQAQDQAAGRTAVSEDLGTGRQKLSGYRRPDLAGAPFVGPLERSAVLRLAIGLPLRDSSALDTLVREVSDPASPNYRQFLSPEEMVQRFSPTAADYEALATFAKTHGMRVVRTYNNRYLLDVTGTVDAVEKALHVKMNNYHRPDGTIFFAPDREPSLDLDVPVYYIAGLENFVLPKRHQTQYPGGGALNSLLSQDFRSVYAGNSTLTGTGQTVGLLEFAAPNDMDIHGNGSQYSGYAGWVSPPPGTSSAWPPFLLWPAGTQQPDLSTATQGELDFIGEAELDIEMAMAMAPGLDQIVVYTVTQIPATNFAGEIANAALIDDAMNAMAHPDPGYPLSLQLSASLTWLSDPMTQQILKTMAAQGQSFFVASGDTGSYNSSSSGCQQITFTVQSGGMTFANDLALDTVTAVGGTLWAAAPDGEIVWNSSVSWSNTTSGTAGGGGIVTGVPIPPYQVGFTSNGASSSNRNVPDVAAAAGNVFSYVTGNAAIEGGTSAATPLWAGFTALVNQQRQNLGLKPGIGFLNPTLYSIATTNYSANFHDITSGNNGTGGCADFKAGTGYDLATGLGSPTGMLIDTLANSPITAANEGDPHLTTLDGVHYDFQSAGEFVALRQGRGLEIQTRQSPVPTAPPAANSYTGLATCVSVNTAVAARVGKHRVTYQPGLGEAPDPAGMQLRVDGALTTLTPRGILLIPGGRVTNSPSGSGIEIDFPEGTILTVTSNWWASQNVWYLNVDIFNAPPAQGIMGATSAGGWLPALPNGASLGAMPGALHQRYVDLYHTFGDAWRVTNAASLFDYAPGTSTASFTVASWPPEQPPCTVPKKTAQKPLQPGVAKKLCSAVIGKARKADCLFDTEVTGEPGFAKAYELSQQIAIGSTRTILSGNKNPSVSGESVTFTATVTRNSSGRAVPAGAVRFAVDGVDAGAPVPVDAKGQAVWKASRLEVGEHQVTARYVPNEGSVYLPSSSLDTPHAVVKELPR